MQYVVALRVTAVGLVALGACANRYHPDPAWRVEVDQVFAAHAVSDRQIPTPVSLDAKPWKVGQWALYKRAGTYPQLGLDGYERISVIAEDACGVWIVDESHGYYDRHRWTFCLRRPSPTDAQIDLLDLVQVAMWESNGGRPEIIDFRFGQFTPRDKLVLRPVISQLVPPRWSADASHQDVDVPAGRFLQAIFATHQAVARKPVEVSEWTHPDVPFDATVRRRTSDGRDYVLLAYGDSGASGTVPNLVTVPASALKPKPSSPTFLSMGFGYGWFSGHASEQSSQTDSFSMVAGTRMGPKVDLISGIGLLVDAGYAPDPMQRQAAFMALVGVRWSPFRLPYLQPSVRPHGRRALYVQADAGYTELVRDTMSGTDTVARGLVFGAGVGWLGYQAHDWALGLELHDHVAVLENAEGVRDSVEFLMRWQLYLPWVR